MMRFGAALTSFLVAGFLMSLLCAQDDVKRLIDKLGSENVEEREEATKKLTQLGKAATGELERAAKSPDAEVAERARRLLRILEVAESRGKNITIYLDKDKKVKLELVWIEPGKFMMGSPGSEPGRSTDEVQHEVTISKGFWMGLTEVTQDQWAEVMGSNPSHFKGDGNLPVDSVSWNDFQEFLFKANCNCDLLDGLKLDLPTEAEWEYACRAGSKTGFSFGDDEGRLAEFAWYNKNSDGKPHSVREKKPNAWGLYDMHGNVWEWCKDYYAVHTGDAVDPKGPDRGPYSLRGGSWGYSPELLRSAYRGSYGVATTSAGYIGGRVVARDTKQENK